MKTLNIAFALIILFFQENTMCAVSSYVYEKKIINNHVIHIVTVNPKHYTVDIVKAANNGTIGRETVSSIAKKSQAEIAINGGFFEIGSNKDGMPSGTLVIHGAQYGVINKPQPLIIIDKGTLSIELSNPNDKIKNDNISIVSGIPMLVQNKEIFDELFTKNTEFYTHSHARTALGVKPDGKIIIVVAEHNYSRDLMAITVGEVQSLMKEKGRELSVKYHKQNPGDITLKELKEILKNEFFMPNTAQGLTILELAKIMNDLGCSDAINLDGGGSSTLWIGDKVVNQTIGDDDEASGKQTIRPVSDAIIFKKR
jgi:hypothetical protein